MEQKHGKRSKRLSMDALEVLELIESEGPFESVAAVCERTMDEPGAHFSQGRVSAAIEELLTTEQIEKLDDGSFRSELTADYSSVSAGDDELGARVTVSVRIYAADPDMNYGVTMHVRAEDDLMSSLVDLVIGKLREANGLGPRRS